MKYTRNQVKSLTNPSAAIPRVPLLPLKKKKIRHHYIYIYIDDISVKRVKKIAAPAVTILLPIRQASGTGAVPGISFAIFRRPWRNRGICRRALHRRQAKFRPPRSSHPSITRRLFARADRSMMYGMIRFLPRALNNSPEGAVPPFFSSSNIQVYKSEFRTKLMVG